MNLATAAFQAELNSHLTAFLEEEFFSYKNISGHFEVISILEQIQNVSRGGKRLRPFLVWSLYQHSNPEATARDIMSLLLAVELFHIFCLIHDDIMDEAKTRHSAPTIHTFARKTFYTSQDANQTRIADSQAILAGDIVFNSVFKLLTKFSTESETDQGAVIATFHRLIDEVCIGQMIDVHLTSQTSVTDKTLNEKNKLKTAYYSFVRPLHLGTIVSKRPDLLAFVTEFGEKMGMVYQIQDDLLDIIGDPNITTKPLFQDVTQNQHTALSNFVRADSKVAEQLLNSFIGKTLTPSDTKALKELFISTGAVANTEEIITKTITEINELMATHQLSTADATLFSSLLGLIIKRTS